MKIVKDSAVRAATLLPEEGEIISEGLNQALADVTADPGVDSVNTPNDFWLHKFRATRAGWTCGPCNCGEAIGILNHPMSYLKLLVERAFGRT